MDVAFKCLRWCCASPHRRRASRGRQESPTHDARPPLNVPTNAVQLSAACPDALSARHARYQSLLRSLELSQRSESSLASLLMWGVYKLEPLELAAAIHAEAWPWWIDGWGALEVVAEHLDRGEGASGGGDDGDG